ncbi:MAG TPA: 3-oxoacyl-ACP reductase, partial [Spirochaetia bacterium]|nr:3-oxoacyl-ACP reductase [Spirochaetia bacterium]
MRIESIGVSVPSRKVTNEDILRMLAENSDGISPIIVKSYQRLVRGLFALAGSDVRYVRDTDKDEKAGTFIIAAMNAALEKANLTKDKIDLLIYCGVGKGFLEPANGYFYAQRMGMSCSCFDIV